MTKCKCEKRNGKVSGCIVVHDGRCEQKAAPKKAGLRGTKFYKSLNGYLATAYAEGFCEGEGATKGEQLAAWQYLVDDGSCWKLQGWFGRTAAALIEQGMIEKAIEKGKVGA